MIREIFAKRLKKCPEAKGLAQMQVVPYWDITEKECQHYEMMK